MAGWLPPALGAGCFIAVHYLFLRAASGRIGDALGALVLETAAAIGIALSFAAGIRGGPVPATRSGVAFAVASGLAVSAASIMLFAALRRGGPVASTGTIVLGGGVALSALAAPWVFGESFTWRRALGVALGIAAIAVLSREDGTGP
jgi:bacterial/archaeal transporter family protein